jgi:hypothetical protein
MPFRGSHLLEEILHFVDTSAGLTSKVNEKGEVSICQSIDGKVFSFESELLEEVLQRIDADGKSFIQVNFNNGIKVLFTDTLVGFKPRETFGLDMTKIPKVVTTPDLLSVFEAIEDNLSSDQASDQEIEILKKVYHAILQGGELAGFDLSFEKKWLARIIPHKFKASA